MSTGAHKEGEQQSPVRQSSDEPITLSLIFDVLKNERRRYVLKYMSDQQGEVRFGDVVDHVAAQRQGVEVGTVDSATRKATYTSLYQSHLPKLDDLDIVVYNQDRGIVESGEHLAEVVQCLDAVEQVRAGTEPAPDRDSESDGTLSSLLSSFGL